MEMKIMEKFIKNLRYNVKKIKKLNKVIMVHNTKTLISSIDIEKYNKELLEEYNKFYFMSYGFSHCTSSINCLSFVNLSMYEKSTIVTNSDLFAKLVNRINDYLKEKYNEISIFVGEDGNILSDIDDKYTDEIKKLYSYYELGYEICDHLKNDEYALKKVLKTINYLNYIILNIEKQNKGKSLVKRINNVK